MDNKLPPQNLEFELSIVAASIWDEEIRNMALSILEPKDFYRTAHALVFEIIQVLHFKGEPVDLVTIANRLKDKGKLDLIGGAAWLGKLPDTVPIPSSVEYYCQGIRDARMKRDMIGACQKLTELSFGEMEPKALFDYSVKAVSQIFTSRGEEAEKLGNTLVRIVEKIEDRSQVKNKIWGIETHFDRLDWATGGLQDDDLIVLASRPSMGKTATALAIAKRVAKHDPVLLFSLEMSKEQVSHRLMADIGELDSLKLRRADLNTEEWHKVSHAASKLYELDLYIDDTGGMNYREICSKARIYLHKHGIRLIIIDHLQLVRGAGNKSRDREIGTYTATFKALAKELKLPVMVLSQLSRAVEQRTGSKRPILSDLRDSGNIEQDADVVGFLYRPAIYEEEEEFEGHTEFLMRKNRNGPVCTFLMKFFPEHGMMRPLDTHHEHQT